MWIIDEETDEVDVTKIHGSVAENILRLYQRIEDARRTVTLTGRSPMKKAPAFR